MPEIACSGRHTEQKNRYSRYHLKKLGKYKTGKSCLYINKFEDIDESIVEKLIDRSVILMRKRYETK
jgi:hypothetical protein